MQANPSQSPPPPQSHPKKIDKGPHRAQINLNSRRKKHIP